MRTVLRKWIRDLAADPQYAFPDYGQMEPEQQEIDRLRREGAKLKAKRDILKGPQPSSRENPHEVRLPREAPWHLVGGMAVQSAGRFPVGLPCLAQRQPQCPFPARRGAPSRKLNSRLNDERFRP